MQIIKRNGQVAEFDPDKIYQAILKAAQTVYVLDDTWRQNLAQVTKKVVLDLQDAQVERPTINMIQSLVENRLMEAGFINIAEHYISYRLQRDLERNGYGDKVIVHLRFEQIRKKPSSDGFLCSQFLLSLFQEFQKVIEFFPMAYL